MSIFSVMTQEQVCALPEKYCTSNFDCMNDPMDGPVVTHPKYPPLKWDKHTRSWVNVFDTAVAD